MLKSFPWFIARRYFRSKKSVSAINIISYLSMAGVAVGTMALIVVLSVFNGFDHLIKSLFNSFDPDIKITVVDAKVFTPDSLQLQQIDSIQGVSAYAFSLEENALFQYGEKQFIGVVKGVSDNYTKVSGIQKTLVQGQFKIEAGEINYGIIGQGVGYSLGYYLGSAEPVTVWVPRRTGDVSFNPEEAFKRKYIYPSGAFAIEQDFDSKYFIVPISFAADLLDYTHEVSSIDIKLHPKANVKDIQNSIQQILGQRFLVQDRYQQEALLYKIMQSEKWAIFFILTFILIVASFNIISSLTMVIIDKKRDISILNHLGADWATIRKVFMFEGWMVTAIGAIIGLVLGLSISFVQMYFGIIKLGGSGSFIVDSYPVLVQFSDIFLVFATIAFIGFLTTWLPVRLISEKYFETREE